MFKIGDIEINNKVVAGPMAGISNAAFREILFENGAGLVYTEMVSDKAIIYQNEKTLKMCEVDNQYHPIAIQLFGSEPESMTKAAIYLDKHTNADIIDINMGCPVLKVIKTGAGSALLKTPDLAVEIVDSIIKNVQKPVTVKMRLGFTKDDLVYLDLAKRLESVGVKAIALHGRTRSQMYEGKADLDHVRILKEAINIPVIANGDIKTVEDIDKTLKETNCDAVMIARGLVGNPFLIKEANDYLAGKEVYNIDIETKLKMCLRHALKLCNLVGEDRAMKMMREIVHYYLKSLPNCSKMRETCNHITKYSELENLFIDYLKTLSY